MNDRWTDKLSEYLDGELGVSDRELLEQHLVDCAECTQVLHELKRVVGRARALDDRRPDVDLWAGVAAGIGASVPALPNGKPAVKQMPAVWRRRLSFSVPQLAAAALAVVMSWSAWAFWAGSQAEPVEVPIAAAPSPVDVMPVSMLNTKYDDAVADLQRLLEAERETLSPATIKVLEESLATIDRAIDSAQEAVRADPESEYLRGHLERTTRQKLTLLRRVTAFTSSS
jgi:hypothetical protein